MRGRPKKPPEDYAQKPCKKPGCDRLCAFGYSYCSRDHAPYGYYGLDKSLLGKWSEHNQQKISEALEEYDDSDET